MERQKSSIKTPAILEHPNALRSPRTGPWHTGLALQVSASQAAAERAKRQLAHLEAVVERQGYVEKAVADEEVRPRSPLKRCWLADDIYIYIL